MQSAGSTKGSIEFTNFALQVLANLTRKEQLRPYIVYNEGLKLLVDKLRDMNNMTGRRIAAEALYNVAEKDEFLRNRIMGEIRDEMKRDWHMEVDPVVNMYLKDFLRRNGDKEAFVYS